MRWMLPAFVALALALAACGGDDAAPSDTPAPTSAATTPTRTPGPTPAPTEKTLTAQSVLEAMMSRGLQTGEYAIYNSNTDPDHLLGQPHQYTSRVNFADLRIRPMTSDAIEVTDGGSIEVFADAADAQTRYETLSTADPGLHTFVEGRALLRITDKLSADQAAEYETAFREIVRSL